MTVQEKARLLRQLIEKAAASLSDDDALDGVELFPWWKADVYYKKEDGKDLRVRDPENGLLYKLIPDEHTSQSDWPPRLVPAIWTRVDEPGDEWPEWRQPTGAQDAYALNAKVSHNGNHWTSDYDNNVWEPGVYGWTMVS